MYVFICARNYVFLTSGTNEIGICLRFTCWN